ncbi:hypothetical protein L6452_40212 [Arctium lappa]|uniref:Uncharacterized protein n=1 Tax=Arctium lappa TaxID=4217 RepID=A0ACB8XMH8_ARCLA|nr:hypothetical protein L6452_40212 [Arctium lappa]
MSLLQSTTSPTRSNLRTLKAAYTSSSCCSCTQRSHVFALLCLFYNTPYWIALGQPSTTDPTRQNSFQTPLSQSCRSTPSLLQLPFFPSLTMNHVVLGQILATSSPIFRAILYWREGNTQSYGDELGVALEVGHDLTQVLSVNDGHSVDRCLEIREFGGSDITDDLMRLLDKKYNEFTMAYRRHEMNETCGYVARDYEAEEKTVEEEKYYLPDGTSLILAKEKCQCTELLFKVNGRVDKGLALHVKETAEDFVGGTMTVYEGGGPRSAIIGGRVLAQLPDFCERYLATKMEYDEAGMDEFCAREFDDGNEVA